MIERILVAVDDSAPALAGARLAVDLAQTCGAVANFVTVAASDHDADALLDHLRHLSAGMTPPPEFTRIDGAPPFEMLLVAARDWRADLIVMGRTDRRRSGVPHLGSQTEHLLEFTGVPVLVVPEPPDS